MRFIEERLEQYKAKVLAALDSNDSIEAIKNRAIQKELEELLKIIELRKVIDFSEYYTTKEVAEIHRKSIAQMTRCADKWGAIKLQGGWYFLKRKVDKSNINKSPKSKN